MALTTLGVTAAAQAHASVGFSYAQFCVSNHAISGSPGTLIGGLAAKVGYGVLNACANYGNVNAAVCGGLVGQIVTDTDDGASAQTMIYNCYDAKSDTSQQW